MRTCARSRGLGPRGDSDWLGKEGGEEEEGNKNHKWANSRDLSCSSNDALDKCLLSITSNPVYNRSKPILVKLPLKTRR